MSQDNQYANFGVRCRGGCEYCSDDAFNVDDLLRTGSNCSTDPREALLYGTQAELYVERVEAVRPKVAGVTPKFKGNSYTMSLSSSRRSSKQKMDDGEFFLECKAAFLSIYDDVSDKIDSKKDLLTVLQQSGRNPSNRALEKYWPRHTDELSFNEFVDICRKEPVTTADDLMKAFRKIDTNGDGYISLDELFKIMNAKGDSMSRDEVRRMIDEVDENKDGRLDYGEFCNMIMKTTNECKKMSMKVMERKERRKKGKTRSDISGTTQEKSKDDHGKHSEHQHHSSKDTDVKEQSKYIKSERGIKMVPVKDASQKTPRDAEQVDEDIQVNDDFDIISPGRPTPRIDLKASPRKESSDGKNKTEHKRSELETDSKSTPRNHKGKAHDTDKDALHAHKHGERKGSVNAEQKVLDAKEKKGDGDSVKSEGFETTGHRGTSYSGFQDKLRSGGNDVIKGPDTDKDHHKHARKYVVDDDKSQTYESHRKQHDDPLHTSRIMDEIFKTSSRSNKDVQLELFELSKADESWAADEVKVSSSDTKPPLPKERNHTHLATPRVEIPDIKINEKVIIEGDDKGHRKDVYAEEKDSKLKLSSGGTIKSKENGFGSQSSLRSGEIGMPVPSPRKAVSRVSEDEMPKPSPRIRPRDQQKTKSGSKGRLPDPRSLRDWSMCTSKGSFFYEDDEIVTHVYSIRLSEDSAVYFSAYPLQEPQSLALASGEPVDTALYILDSRGKLVTFTEQKDSRGRYGVKCDLSAGEYQIIPYTTGCRFKQRSPNDHVREAKLVKKDKDDKIVITSAFRKALEDIFDLCDLDDNGTMSKDEFNWFNLRTSGEALGEDEWEVVEERTSLEKGEITKRGFIELNEMEAEDSQGDVEDLWITLTSMGLNKALIMDEACPFRVEVYVERSGRREPKFKCTGIESLQKKELVDEICQSVIEKSQSDPVKVRHQKDVTMHTYKNDHRATVALENRSRSRVNVEVDCSKSKNAVSHRDSLEHTVEVEPQSMAIAHHLVPAREGADWTVICT